MRNQKKLLVEQLDRKLLPFQSLKVVAIPEKGWIQTIRTSLNMSLRQLAKKLDITTQGAKNIEYRESKGSISINILKEVANALDMKFVYGFVPKQNSMEEYIESKAKDLARKIVLRTSHNMVLEDQGNTDNRIKQSINELADDITREMKKSLWD